VPNDSPTLSAGEYLSLAQSYYAEAQVEYGDAKLGSKQEKQAAQAIGKDDESWAQYLEAKGKALLQQE